MPSDGSVTITRPAITAASILPNPADAKASITIAISAVEQIIVLEPTWFYSGEIFSGEG